MKHSCDHCGAERAGGGNLLPEGWRVLIIADEKYIADDDVILCDNCYSDFLEWLGPGRKEDGV